MSSAGTRDRLVLLAVGLLVLLGPVLILVITLEILVLFGDLELGQITLVEFLELYLVELTLFVGLAYGIYRLTLWSIETRLPASLGAIESREADERVDDESETSEET